MPPRTGPAAPAETRPPSNGGRHHQATRSSRSVWYPHRKYTTSRRLCTMLVVSTTLKGERRFISMPKGRGPAPREQMGNVVPLRFRPTIVICAGEEGQAVGGQLATLLPSLDPFCRPGLPLLALPPAGADGAGHPAKADRPTRPSPA